MSKENKWNHPEMVLDAINTFLKIQTFIYKLHILIYVVNKHKENKENE